MLNRLIKSDFIKLRKSKTLIVCSIIAFCLAVLMSLLLVNGWNSNGNGESIEQATEMLLEMGMDKETVDMALSIMPRPYLWSYANYFLSDGVISILAAICVSVFTASEYSMGTLKNTLSRGFSRTQIYLSKLLVSCVSVIVLAVVYLLGGMIICGIFLRGISELTAVQMILCILSYLCLFLAMTSVYYMIAIVIRKTGVTIAMSLVIPNIVASILSTIAYSIKDFSEISQYWLFNTPSVVQRMCVNGQAYIPILTALVYFAVSTAAGLIISRKQEVK